MDNQKSNQIFRKRIGVLGGMGPTATAEFYIRLIRLAQERFGARRNDQYPHVLVCNLPVPDLISNKTRQGQVFKMLVDGIKTLEQAGAELVVIPCNTVHLFFDELEKKTEVPLLNLIDLVVEEVAASQVKRVGILATMTTLGEELYQRALEKRGINYCVPTGKTIDLLVKAELMEVAGEERRNIHGKVLSALRQLREKGADGIILGCTELPLLVKKNDTHAKVFDTLQILAEKTLEFASKKDDYD